MKISLLILVLLVLSVPVMAQEKATLTIKSDSKTIYITDEQGNRLASLTFDNELDVKIKRQEKPRAYLIDKSRAYQIYRGDELKEGDLQLFVEGANTAGKIAIVLKAKDLESFKDGFEMTGIVGGRRVVIADCLQGVHRGEECTVHRQRQ